MNNGGALRIPTVSNGHGDFAMKPVLLTAILLLSPGLALAEDLTGEWDLSSGAGNFHCTLLQKGGALDGSCATADAPRGPRFIGDANGARASWDFDAPVGGRKERVGVNATITSDRSLSGTLTLAGKSAPFTATME